MYNDIIDQTTSKQKAMADAKQILRGLVEGLAFLIWGTTFVDLIGMKFLTISSDGIASVIESTIKLATAILGLVYFFLRIRQYTKETRFKNREKLMDLEIKRKRLDLEIFELYEAREREKRKVRKKGNTT